MERCVLLENGKETEVSTKRKIEEKSGENSPTDKNVVRRGFTVIRGKVGCADFENLSKN